MASSSSSKEGSLATTREQRKNAGNKMSKLLADELGDDDFYKTALGGFEEESEDDEYASDSDDEDSDQVDSDFSLSETDDVVEQDEEDDTKRKHQKNVYKEPKKAKISKQDKPSTSKKPAQVKNVIAAQRLDGKPGLSDRRKSSRALTVESSEMHRKRMEKTKKVGKKQVKFSQTRKLTQQELLAEAKITEELNIKSLKAYQQMEESKKKTKNVKAVRNEPMIRYLSVTMPLVEPNEDEINIEDDAESTKNDKENSKCSVASKCSRNFIIFTDPKTYPGTYFSTKKITMPQKAYCPVTGLPAKYMDPVTGMPYANTRAFRYIRAHYAKQGTDGPEKFEKKTRSGRKVTSTLHRE